MSTPTNRERKEAAQIASHEMSCGGALREWDCGCSFECHCDAGRMNRVCVDCGSLFRENPGASEEIAAALNAEGK